MAGAASPLPACCAPPAHGALRHTAGRQSSCKTNTNHAHQRRPHHKGPRDRGGGCSPGSSHSQQREGPVPKAPATACLPLMRVPSGPGLHLESCRERMAPALAILCFVLLLPCYSLNMWFLYFTCHDAAMTAQTLPRCQPAPALNPISSLQTPQHRLPFARVSWHVDG